MPDFETQHDRSPGQAPGAMIVSGASGAVGRTIAERLAATGRPLVLPVRSDPSALEARFPNATIVQADLLNPDDARSVASTAIEAHGSIAALINVAGGFGMGSAVDLDPADLERQLDLNLRTAVHLTTACLAPMVDRGSGTIVAVSAGAARTGGKNMAAYAASKGALEGYLRSVAAEVEGHGLAVSLLIPAGAVDTPDNREAMPGADRSGWVAREALADATLYLLERTPRGRVAELRVHA